MILALALLGTALLGMGALAMVALRNPQGDLDVERARYGANKSQKSRTAERHAAEPAAVPGK